uniref:Cytochrome b5 heme-binding domain-containing protein n=1 Tax=Leersia perrieri TaxID=77586 RepID=A0A0D9XXU9_9ORYZ
MAAEEDASKKKLFAASDVAGHSSRKDCWVVIHGKVYDVTRFLEDHPGGEDVLLHASVSGDATEAFEDVGHSTSAISMMNGYLIGSIKDYVPPSASKDETIGSNDMPPDFRRIPGKKGPPAPNTFLDFLLPLFMLGLAFAAWYYLTFIAKS